MLLGHAAMINWSNVANEHRSDYYRWHGREHMRTGLQFPGFYRGRRYISACASRDFLVMYELESLAALESPEYKNRAENPSALTLRTTPAITASVRGLARIRATLGFGMGAAAATVRFGTDVAVPQLTEYVRDQVSALLCSEPELMGGHLLETDAAASGIVRAERKGRPTAIPSVILIIEAFTVDTAARACESMLARNVSRYGVSGDIRIDTYLLQYSMTKEEGEVCQG